MIYAKEVTPDVLIAQPCTFARPLLWGQQFLTKDVKRAITDAQQRLLAIEDEVRRTIEQAGATAQEGSPTWGDLKPLNELFSALHKPTNQLPLTFDDLTDMVRACHPCVQPLLRRTMEEGKGQLAIVSYVRCRAAYHQLLNGMRNARITSLVGQLASPTHNNVELLKNFHYLRDEELLEELKGSSGKHSRKQDHRKRKEEEKKKGEEEEDEEEEEEEREKPREKGKEKVRKEEDRNLSNKKANPRSSVSPWHGECSEAEKSFASQVVAAQLRCLQVCSFAFAPTNYKAEPSGTCFPLPFRLPLSLVSNGGTPTPNFIVTIFPKKTGKVKTFYPKPLSSKAHPKTPTSQKEVERAKKQIAKFLELEDPPAELRTMDCTGACLPTVLKDVFQEIEALDPSSLRKKVRKSPFFSPSLVLISIFCF